MSFSSNFYLIPSPAKYFNILRMQWLHSIKPLAWFIPQYLRLCVSCYWMHKILSIELLLVTCGVLVHKRISSAARGVVVAGWEKSMGSFPSDSTNPFLINAVSHRMPAICNDSRPCEQKWAQPQVCDRGLKRHVKNFCSEIVNLFQL